MPSFDDYKCAGCGHTFEEMLRMADVDKPTKAKCPSCKKKKVELVVGAGNGLANLFASARQSLTRVGRKSWRRSRKPIRKTQYAR
jgi:putative FmdB family regulatory protein